MHCVWALDGVKMEIGMAEQSRRFQDKDNKRSELPRDIVLGCECKPVFY